MAFTWGGRSCFWFLGDGSDTLHVRDRWKNRSRWVPQFADFTEPMFVFVIMVIAGTKPILDFTAAAVQWTAHFLPINRTATMYFLVLALVPLLGSFITEPAAMTLAALMLRDSLFSQEISNKLKYATVGVLFVNISIGGTLTPFAAPPVLMVAGKWDWDFWFMITNFGWKSALAVTINALTVTFLLAKS